MKSAWGFLKETFDGWWDDNAPQLAAALAFYTIFSFAPILILVIAAVSVVFGREAVRAEVIGWVQETAGSAGARVIQTVLNQARRQSSLATAVGLGTLLFGATVVFVALQDALNTIWNVMVKPGRTVRLFFKKRLFSFFMLLGIGLLLMASLVMSTVLTAVETYLGELLPVPSYVLQAGQFGVSFGIITVLFAVVYKVLPDVRISWSDVWIGAAATSLLFTIGKTLIGIYLVKSTVGSAYGAAGSFVVLLVWVYYSAQVFFLGAEFTQVYARRRGSPIVPDDNAVRTKKVIQTNLDEGLDD